MKRHPALQDLSRDHFTAMLRALHVRRAVTGDGRAPPLEDAKTAFLDLWDEGLALHFEEEETCLVPVMQRHARGAEEAALLDRILQEHGDLRAGFKRLARGSADGDWHHIATALTDHARWEEEAFFPWFEAHLDDGALDQLWEDSKAFRLRTRGPASIGPPPGGRPGGLASRDG